MTIAANRTVRFYDLHLWLNPFGLQRKVMFTPLSPTEIAMRMRHNLTDDHHRIRSREYRDFDRSVNRFLDEAPRMTTTEREHAIASLLAWTPSRRLGRSLATSTALPWGLELQLHYPGSRRLEVRYDERPGGTVLHLKLAAPIFEMRTWYWLFMAPYMTFLFVPELLDARTWTFSRPIWFESLIYLGCPFVLLLYLFYQAINRWRRRNELLLYRDFLAETIDARDVGSRQ